MGLLSLRHAVNTSNSRDHSRRALACIVMMTATPMARSLAVLILVLPAVADARGRIEVTAPNAVGARFARQALPATGYTALAKSKTIYLNHDDIVLRPGDNDSAN